MDRANDANFQQDGASGPSLNFMGRASGRAIGASSQARRTGPARDASAWVRSRLAPFVGLDVVREGRLDEPYGGHPTGTAFVVISADCLQEATLAEQMLAPYSGVPPLAWERGWQTNNADGQQRLELTIFPSLAATE